MRERTEKKEKYNINRRLLIRSLLSMAVVIAVLATATYAWFTDRTSITTLVDIKAPTAISILGPHGEAQASLDMSYTDEDIDENKKVTIRRVVSVSSGAAHQLEIVHTTNLKGLTFKIYRATESDSGNAQTGVDSVATEKYVYTYDSDKPLEGSYINQRSESNSYRYANADMHSSNFDAYSNVQAHAEPIYWLAKDVQQSDAKPSDRTDLENDYLTYYVIEISWTETSKETDIFYLLAQNQ